MPQFTIDKVLWHTRVKGAAECRDKVDRRFKTIASFLNRHSLVVRAYDIPEGPLPDSFQISSSDLTEEGLRFMKLAYDSWLRGLDRGADPSNADHLTRALQKLRST